MDIAASYCINVTPPRRALWPPISCGTLCMILPADTFLPCVAIDFFENSAEDVALFLLSTLEMRPPP